jgi:hypothetical protein
MQQVAETHIAPRPREQAAAAPQVTAKRRVDPWMLAVPLIVFLAWGVIFGWIALFVFLVSGADWMGNAWQLW